MTRWIAVALLTLLPFAAQAQEALVRSTDAAPIHITFQGDDATLSWQCRATGIDGFHQCGLMLDKKVLTWRMAREGDELLARVNYSGKAVRFEVSRARKP
jgi:hypothetical protein